MHTSTSFGRPCGPQFGGRSRMPSPQPHVHLQPRRGSVRTLATDGAAAAQPPSDAQPPQGFFEKVKAWFAEQKAKTQAVREKIGSYGLSAVLAYGLFDAVTYTTFFYIAFHAYEAQTGINPTTNVKAVIQILLGMWLANNSTRPFRVGGAAVAAPFLSKVLKFIQEKLRLKREIYAFALVVGITASIALSIIGSLYISRMV